MKERILRGCKAIPTRNLVNYIKGGRVSLSELIDAGLSEDKVQEIKNLMAKEDDTAWNEAKKSNTLESYRHYASLYPEGNHSGDAHAKIDSCDDSYWNQTIHNLSESTLNSYMEQFPDGKHVSDCKDLISDLPWIKVCRENTIAAYEEYRNQYPDKHSDDIDKRINDLNDDEDWNNACLMGDTDAFRRYINQHPNGKHVSEAQSRIQASAGHDKFLEDLESDPNSHDAREIQTKVGNNVVSWDDIARVFGEDKMNAIRDFRLPAPLPENAPPPKLQGDSTEVYFWGTPSSGKTCALGSIIGGAQSEGILEKIPCNGYDYMTRLSNIFDKEGFCTFPDSTSIENIQEMILKLRDKKSKRQHKLTLVDLAGELFRSAYFKQINKLLSRDKEEMLDIALNYLRDSRNEKIHFFVVEYGAHDFEWEGLKMKDYLDYMISFLKKEKVFKKSTAGVYVLVTKCDKISCDKKDRPKMAYDYVTEIMPSFWNNLESTCKEAHVGDLKVLSFSVGDVFAKNLCVFDGEDTSKVIDKLITKTHARGGFWDWFRK